MKLELWKPSINTRGLLHNFFDMDWPFDYEKSYVPSVNIKETKDSFKLSVELPGVTKEDVKVEIDDNMLTISGEKKFEEETKKEDYCRVESRYGSFSRSFTLPKNVDASKIDATFKNGVLKISLNKTEGSKPKQIEVN